MSVPTSVKLSPETNRKLDELAARTGRSKSYYLREAIESQIDRIVFEYDVLDRLEDARAGRGLYNRDEAATLLGLDD